MRSFFARRRISRYLSCVLLLFCLTGLAEGRNTFTLEEKLLNRVQKKYGQNALRRLQAWEKLVQDDSTTTDMEKLQKVNNFFNKMEFVDDQSHWGQQDYWATPVEFLASGGGDCEDFALAKYFTLKAIGVAEKRLNMTYVKALTLNQAHMVVTYHSTPAAVPLVLDNLVVNIEPATKRKDLLPVYSFNGSGLWLAKSRSRGQLVGKSDRLKRWQDLLQRMPEGLN